MSLIFVCLLKIFLLIKFPSIISVIPSDFVFEIAGSSIIAAMHHVCVIEYRHGIEIGGKVLCIDSEITNPMKDTVFIQIAGGSQFNCGIAIDQTLHCWDYSQHDIPGFYTQITVNGFYGCGILTDGRISCWGNSPIIRTILNDTMVRKYVQISCQKSHCCALDENAYPHCWDERQDEHVIVPRLHSVDGEILQSLGINEDSRYEIDDEDQEDDEIENRNQFIESSPEFGKIQFRQISVGVRYSCGITYQGQHLLCWGDDVVARKTYPRFVKGPLKQVSLGGHGLCIITAEEMNENKENEVTQSNRLECWGSSKNVIPDDLQEEWDQVLVGDFITCAVSMDSELRCWGRSFTNQLPTSIVVA